MIQSVTVPLAEFCKSLNMEIVHPGRGEVLIVESEINRPGLQLTGYYEQFAETRVQIIGNAEMHYILQMPHHMLQTHVRTLMSFDLPCIIFSRGHRPPAVFIEQAQERGIPILVSDRSTSKVSHSVTNYAERALAPTITRHGVLLDVYGIGVMLTGESGTGKSETALELVQRGHRLVADDVLEIRRVAENRLSGAAPTLTRHLLEIRGIGIIDVRYMYGVAAVIAEKSIEFVIEFEMWVEGKPYDRLGLDEETTEILGVDVPRILIPVRPGRNLAIITEVAARNFRLKKLGYNAAKEFDKRWLEELKDN